MNIYIYIDAIIIFIELGIKSIFLDLIELELIKIGTLGTY